MKALETPTLPGLSVQATQRTEEIPFSICLQRVAEIEAQGQVIASLECDLARGIWKLHIVEPIRKAGTQGRRATF